MFGRKNKVNYPTNTGSTKMDFELRRMLNLGGISPPNSTINPGDPGVPPLPATVDGGVLIEKTVSSKD